MFKFILQKLSSLHNFLATPPKVCWIDKSIFEYVNRFKGKAVLNLGAGSGIFDDLIQVETINLDIKTNPRIHVVTDAHKLPFKDSSIDCVFSNAVLEHVQFPWIVSKEVHRVLKMGGVVCINVPFLNIIHGETDYFRFTNDGLRSCFHDFKEIKSGMSAGPMAFLVIYLGSLVTTLFNIRVIMFLISLSVMAILYPLFYLDPLLKGKKWETFADAFYFIGIKE